MRVTEIIKLVSKDAFQILASHCNEKHRPYKYVVIYAFYIKI